MKKITQPQINEEAVYYSDFSGHCFGEFFPEVEIKIAFNYGSKYDGEWFGLHITHQEFESIFDIIRNHISQDYKKFLQKNYNQYLQDYEQACSNRDWQACENINSSINLIRNLLNIEEKTNEDTTTR